MFVDGDIRGKINIAEGRVTIGANGRVTPDTWRGKLWFKET